MFWIGMSVGIITTIVMCFAYIAYCFYEAKVDYVEYCDMRDAVAEALYNRESTITVVHNDEVLSEVTLKEK